MANPPAKVAIPFSSVLMTFFFEGWVAGKRRMRIRSLVVDDRRIKAKAIWW